MESVVCIDFFLSVDLGDSLVIILIIRRRGSLAWESPTNGNQVLSFAPAWSIPVNRLWTQLRTSWAESHRLSWRKAPKLQFYSHQRLQKWPHFGKLDKVCTAIFLLFSVISFVRHVIFCNPKSGESDQNSGSFLSSTKNGDCQMRVILGSK